MRNVPPETAGEGFSIFFYPLSSFLHDRISYNTYFAIKSLFISIFKFVSFHFSLYVELDMPYAIIYHTSVLCDKEME